MEQEKYFGTIFLPDTPNNLVRGVWLIISSNDIYIEAIDFDPGKDKWEIILGCFNGIDEITFIECSGGAASSGAGGRYKRIHIRYLIKGIHAKASSELLFKRINLRSPALTSWIVEKDSIDYIDRNTIRIPKEKDIATVQLTDSLICFTIVYPQSLRYGANNAFQVKKGCDVSIEFDTSGSLPTFLKMIRHLKNLILFLTYKNPEFDEYVLFLASDNNNVDLLKTKENINENKFSVGLKVSYRYIESQFSGIIKNWIGIEKLHPVINLILEACYNPEISEQGYFLNVCMGIEIFHTAFISSEEIYFVQRLLYFSPTIEYLIDGIFLISTDEFIRKIKRVRNNVVHEGTYQKDFSGFQLFVAAKVIEFTLRLEMMKQIGINIEQKPDSMIDKAKSQINSLLRMNGIRNL